MFFRDQFSDQLDNVEVRAVAVDFRNFDELFILGGEVCELGDGSDGW